MTRSATHGGTGNELIRVLGAIVDLPGRPQANGCRSAGAPDFGPLRAPLRHTETVLDIPVERGPTPGPWDAPVVWRGVLWADENRALFRRGPIGAYVELGHRVVLDTPTDAEASEHDYVIYSIAARMLLIQRRRFSLHATLVVAPSGTMIAVAGDSMAGKSTSVLELVRRGWTFSCDDIAEVMAPGATAVPYERPIHLSDQAARMLGADPAIGRPLPGRGKRAYRLAGDLTPRPLAAVVRLSADAEGSPAFQRLDPVAALVLLTGLSERLGIAELQGLRADHLAWLGDLLRHVPVFQLRRPAGGDTVAQVGDLVETIAQQLAPVL